MPQITDPKHCANVERRAFILRSHAHKNMSEADFNKEIGPLEQEIRTFVQNVFKEDREKFKGQVQEIKETVIEDGNFKRAVARLLITKLQNLSLPNDEIKGIMRQGYKICRDM